MRDSHGLPAGGLQPPPAGGKHKLTAAHIYASACNFRKLLKGYYKHACMLKELAISAEVFAPGYEILRSMDANMLGAYCSETQVLESIVCIKLTPIHLKPHLGCQNR